MNARQIPLISALSLACAAVSMPATRAQDPAAEFDAYVAQAHVDWEVPGLALALVKDGKVVLAKGYGVRALGSDEVVDEHTLFSIGSTTKAMTVATLGLLVDAGELDWDDRVTRHWPAFRLRDPYVTRELTVRDLLTHRAGLGNADRLWYGSDRTRAEILARVDLIEPAYSLRTGFIYQNIMYVAAGELAARLAGMPWEELVTSRVLRPLGMERSVPTTTAAERMQNVARPHDRVDGAVTLIENETLDSVAPAGAVWSSARDMSRWMRMLLQRGEFDGQRILGAAVVDEMLKPQVLLDLADLYPHLGLLEPNWISYGLGWFQLDYQGRAVSFHTGSIDGMAAIVGLIPDEDLGIVVLANLDHAELRHALMLKAFDLFGSTESQRDWSTELHEFYGERARAAAAKASAAEQSRQAGTQPTLALERYAGTYSHELYGAVEVTSAAGGLRFMAAARLSGELEHWHFDTFQARFDRAWRGRQLVSFQLDEAGLPVRLEMQGLAFTRLADER